MFFLNYGLFMNKCCTNELEMNVLLFRLIEEARNAVISHTDRHIPFYF